jgi:hypothetical protein
VRDADEYFDDIKDVKITKDPSFRRQYCARIRLPEKVLQKIAGGLRMANAIFKDRLRWNGPFKFLIFLAGTCARKGESYLAGIPARRPNPSRPVW